MPDFRDYAVDVPSPGAVDGGGHACQGRFLRDVLKLNARRANFRVFSPDETASNRWNARVRGDQPRLDGRDPADDDHVAPRRPRHGDAQRAPVPGLAGGLSAHRPPRLLLLLRGVHPHHRLDVQPARQVAEGHAATFPGGGRSPRSTTCSPRTSGGRTTTASATRTPASSTTW